MWSRFWLGNCELGFGVQLSDLGFLGFTFQIWGFGSIPTSQTLTIIPLSPQDHDARSSHPRVEDGIVDAHAGINVGDPCITSQDPPTSL